MIPLNGYLSNGNDKLPWNTLSNNNKSNYNLADNISSSESLPNDILSIDTISNDIFLMISSYDFSSSNCVFSFWVFIE